MEPIARIEGTALPLDRADVDTDQIIPSEWLKRVERAGFGEGLFSDWSADPDFVLNQPQYAGAAVLVAGSNFGCGSSREHAVWALMDRGFRAVISPSFADIFRTNCTKSGLLPVQVDAELGEKLMRAVEADPGLAITIDVETGVVAAPSLGLSASFPLDTHTRWRFLEGLDDIGLTLRHTDAIAAYEQGRPAWLPVTAAPGQ
jgi:3-isopropylmalate/(R)-2-methylmalate dehydratase small subunit